MTNKKLYDADGRWVSLDARHGITKEFTGAPKAQWVFRFCDDFQSAHATKRGAIDAALAWEMARVARMTG